ncbi:MAG: class I SAM-dependent methyltransferase [Bryobacteraceae bacterium]|nr:class I SAM-dependent methyltransferase [Bryobacteraceae bacterium]
MRYTTVVVFLLALTIPACAQRRGFGRGMGPGSESFPPKAKNDAEKLVLDTINAAVQNGDLYANVPAADGRLLRMLVEASNAKNVIEIGASTGLSGMWIALGLQKTGGKLTTFELDKERAASARANYRKAGVGGIVTLVEGDAHENVRKLKEPVDVVFIDADKEGYVDYLKTLLPLVKPGGLILAHNADMISEYLREVNANPYLDTVIYTAGGGMAVTLKKR